MIKWALRQYMTARARAVESSLSNPHAAQRSAFARLSRLLHGSEIARSSGFDRCRQFEDCRRIPPSDSLSMQPLFQTLYENGSAAHALIGRSRLHAFARTSGTQGEPKHIPMNAAYVASLDRTLEAMVASHYYTSGRWDKLLSGRHILLGSRPRCGTAPCGLPVCDISGFIPTRTWWSARWLYIPHHKDLWIEDWSAKMDRILDQARDKRVVSITGIPALAEDFAVRAMSRFGISRLTEVWPDLSEYTYGACHLSAAEQARITRAWVGAERALRIYETYVATEAALGFSFDHRDEGLALNLLENLYLLSPHSNPGEFLFPHEAREGIPYSVHVTTPGGLVNYRMGDLIEVVSTRPLLVKVVGREYDELSMTGEKITLAQLDLALEAAGLSAARFTPYKPVVWIERAGLPHLVWALPPATDGEAIDLNCAARLDQELCKRNVLYEEAKAREGVVGDSRVVTLAGPVFSGYQDGQLGIGQFKPKRMFQSHAEFMATYLRPE